MAITELRGIDAAGVTRSFLDYATSKQALEQSQERSFLDFALSMKSLEERKAARLAEKESREMYYDIMGRQVSLAEKKHDYLEELEREYKVTKWSALGDKYAAKEAKAKIEVFKDMDDDELKRMFMADTILKEMRASNIALRDQTTMLQQQISTQDFMRRQLESARKGIATEVDAIYSADNLPAELKIQYGREMKQALMGVEGVRTPIDIRADIGDAITKERTRALKEAVGEKKREEDVKTKEIRERAAEWPPEKASDRTMYEYGSYLEMDVAYRNRQDPPEVRYVYYDPVGWGMWTREDATKLGVPAAYQKGAYKLMTENRAKALGLHNEWLSGPNTDTSSDAEIPRLREATSEETEAMLRKLLNE